MKRFSETYADSGIGRWMKQSAGGEPGWDRYNTSGERAGKCGDAKDGDAYSACLSPEKAKKLGKEGIADFVRRKRAAQKKAGDKSKGGEEKKGQKPVFVKTKANEETLHEKNVPLNPALWDKAIAKAKSKFDVYPSAYANAWASKWYKEQGGKWTKKESVELDETKGEYQGKEVDLDNPFRLPQGSDKKFGVYVKNDKGNVVKVKFGDPNLSIKRDHEDRLKNFRARHNCDEKTDKTTPGYWSCKFWEKDSPVSKLLSKGDVTEDVQLDESIDSLKGWVNPKTKKVYTTERMRPYHVEFIVKKPKDFGLNKKQILDYLEKKFDAMDAPDPEESAKQDYEDILAGRNDIDRGIELLAMKKGWYRVVGGKFASIAGEKKLNDKQVGIILSMMEDEGLVGEGAGIYTREVGLEYYKDFGRPDVHPSIKYYGTVEGADIQNLIKGKPRGTGRTEIGQTMAMFRGESFEISQLDEAVDPKDMLRIFNDLDKGDTIKVKFKSVMASATKNFVELVVTSGRRTVGKAKVERIILKSKKNPSGVKYFLYRRGDSVSFAMGDMAAIVDDIQESMQIDEGIKDRIAKQLMKMTPVADKIARNPSTVHLAVSLVAIPAVNAILKRFNYDNMAKVIDLADFLKDTVSALGAETDSSMCEDRVMKYSQFLNINGDTK